MAKTKSSTKIKIGAALATGIIGAALIFGIGKNVADLNLGRDVSDIMLGSNQTSTTAFVTEEEVNADTSIVSYIQEYQATRDAVYGSTDLEEESTETEEQDGEEQDGEEQGSEEQGGEEQSGSNNPFGSLKDATEAGNKSDNVNEIEPEPEEETTGELVNDSVLDQDNVSDSYNEKNPSNIETGKGTNETIKGTFSDSQRTGVAPNVWVVAGLGAGLLLAGGIGLGVGLGTRGKKLAKVETKLNANSSNYAAVVEFQSEVEKLYETGDEKWIDKIKKSYKKCKDAKLNNLQDAELKQEYAERAKYNKTLPKNNTVGEKYDEDAYKKHNEAIAKIAATKKPGKKIAGKGEKSLIRKIESNKINKYNASADEKMQGMVFNGDGMTTYDDGVPTFTITKGDNQDGQTFPISIKRRIAHSDCKSIDGKDLIDGENLQETFRKVQKLFPVAGKQTNICKITLTTNAGPLDLKCSFDAGIGYEVCKAALFVEIEKIQKTPGIVITSVKVEETQQTNKNIGEQSPTEFNCDINNKNNNISGLIKRIDAAKEVMENFNAKYDMVNERVFKAPENTKTEKVKPIDNFEF